MDRYEVREGNSCKFLKHKEAVKLLNNLLEGTDQQMDAGTFLNGLPRFQRFIIKDGSSEIQFFNAGPLQ